MLSVKAFDHLHPFVIYYGFFLISLDIIMVPDKTETKNIKLEAIFKPFIYLKCNTEIYGYIKKSSKSFKKE